MNKLTLTKFFALFLMLAFVSSCGDDEESLVECLCQIEDFPPLYKGCLEETCNVDVIDCSREAMYLLVGNEITYPLEARENSIQGTVIIEFLVNTEGVPSNFQAVNDPLLGFGLEEEALEAARKLSDLGFYPQHVDCEPVEHTFTFPITFQL